MEKKMIANKSANIAGQIKLKNIKEFEIKLPRGDRITGETTTTDRILRIPLEQREKYRIGLHNLFEEAFGKMPEKDRDEYVQDYFTAGTKNHHRQIVLLRNPAWKIVGTCLFDQGKVEHGGQAYIAVYGIMRAVSKEYQGLGLIQTINEKILNELQPDVLIGNCYHSGTIHAWAGVLKKKRVKDYTMYPRLDSENGKNSLTTLPYSELDFAISVFRQMNIRLVGKPEIVNDTVAKLTVNMVMKNTHGGVYDYNPWERNGRKDDLAKALGVTEKDGILLVIKKNHPSPISMDTMSSTP